MPNHHLENSHLNSPWQFAEWAHYTTREHDHVAARGERQNLPRLLDEVTILNSIPENIWMVSTRQHRDCGVIISCRLTRAHACELQKWRDELSTKLNTNFVFDPKEINEKYAAFFAEIGGSTRIVSDLDNVPNYIQRWFPGPPIPSHPARIAGVPRTDLTHLGCFSVDDRNTRFAEQAISTERMPDGTLRAWVHIVDASAAIPPFSRLGKILLANYTPLMERSFLKDIDSSNRFRESVCFHPQRQSEALSTAIDFRPDLSVHYHKPVLSTVGACQRVPHGTLPNESLVQLRRSLLSRRRNQIGADPFQSMSKEPGEICRQLFRIFVRSTTDLMIAENIPAAYSVIQTPNKEAKLHFSNQVALLVNAAPVNFDAHDLTCAQIREVKFQNGISFNPGSLVPCRMFSTLPGEPNQTTASLTSPLRHLPDLVNFWQLTARLYGFAPLESNHLTLINHNLNSRAYDLGVAERPAGTIKALTLNANRRSLRMEGVVSHIANDRIGISVKHMGRGRLEIPDGYELKSAPIRLQRREMSEQIDLEAPLPLIILGFDLKRREWLFGLS